MDVFWNDPLHESEQHLKNSGVYVFFKLHEKTILLVINNTMKKLCNYAVRDYKIKKIVK
jgi:hypothetical protein